jgi:serpin B
MKKSAPLWLFVTVMVATTFTVSCEKAEDHKQPEEPVNISIEPYQKEIIDSANSFAFGLFNSAINDTKGGGNILISPFSVTTALSMALNGAAGETYEDMRGTLGFNNKTIDQINDTYLKLIEEMVPVDSRVILGIANSVWVEKQFQAKEEFINALKEFYEAEARTIDKTDPYAVKTVNDWIAEKTHDKIKNMLDELNPDMVMLLINAIYFNGKWKYSFDKSETKEKPFYLNGNNPEQVPMMHIKTSLNAVRTDNVTIADIPYGQGNFSMVVVLPDEGTGTEEIAGALTESLWNNWITLLETNKHDVSLSMPKFKYEYKRTLNDDLKNMGMGIAFSDLADFSNISDIPVMISTVLHQAFIENNEEGTEAAAATVVEFTNTSVNPGSAVESVILDRPFLYFIRECSTGTILFTGRVNDPLAD